MALTILSRPQGHIADMLGAVYTPAQATISSSSGALFTCASHGLSTGDFIFIDSILSAYNGYWYVSVVTANTFRIREYAAAADQAYVNHNTITFYKCIYTHGWSAVHLPIIYKISSNLWPTNSADTVRTVSSISNDGGYVNLNLSGDIKATGSANELEFVKITGQNEGIYQIINWVSDSDITIDFPYNAGVTFTGSSVQYYYKNYSVRIRIYAGLNSTNPFYALNPYEQIVELDLVPDENGIVTVNVADYVKAKINVGANDTTLDSLPLDINAFCQFYIETAEAYTYSNGYTLGTQVSSYTSDQGNFEGYAVNAMLPFKTQSSGFMDEYVVFSPSTISGKPLSAVRAELLISSSGSPSIDYYQNEIFPTQYYDISYILDFNPSATTFDQTKVKSGSLDVTTSTPIPSYGAGVYRFRVTVWDSGYDYIQCAIFKSSPVISSYIHVLKISMSCAPFETDLVWKNYLGGHDYFRFNAGNQLSNKLRKEESSKNIFANWPKSYGKFADTVNRNTKVEGNKSYLIRSQFIEKELAEQIINGVENSILVQIQTDDTDRRTVLVDSSNTLDETDKLVELQFRLKYTDDTPVQSL